MEFLAGQKMNFFFILTVKEAFMEKDELERIRIEFLEKLEKLRKDVALFHKKQEEEIKKIYVEIERLHLRSNPPFDGFD